MQEKRNRPAEPSAQKEKKPLNDRAVQRLRQREQAQARLYLLWGQGLAALLLFGALLLLRTAQPQQFLSVREVILSQLEDSAAEEEFVHFASALLQSIPLPGALAEAPAPSGCSDERYCPARGLTFPLGTEKWRLSSVYGWRIHPISGLRRFHKGDDLACAEGSPVLAAQEGIVVQSSRSASYGCLLRVRHADGVETLYAHMQYLFVRVGELVGAGQILGTAGQTGEATGPHLHFELLHDGVRVDPSKALGLA